jgi:hypothetical protein
MQPAAAGISKFKRCHHPREKEDDRNSREEWKNWECRPGLGFWAFWLAKFLFAKLEFIFSPP